METYQMDAQANPIEDQPAPNNGPPLINEGPFQGPPFLQEPIQGPPFLEEPIQGPPFLEEPIQGPPFLQEQIQGPPFLEEPIQGTQFLQEQIQGPPFLEEPIQDPSLIEDPNNGPPNNEQTTNEQPNNVQHHPKKKKKKKRKPPQSGDIVFSKGNSFQTMPSLSKLLKDATETIIGLQYVWEYRSPSQAVQPHYQCKLCSLHRVQHDMIDHVKGWKHSYRYMKKTHPDKVTWEEEDGVKDPVVRKAIKSAAAEVEKAEGRGQIKVILKEPYLVPAFKGLRSAAPAAMPPPNKGMGPMGPSFGPRFHNSRFQGEFPPHRGAPSNYQGGEYEEPGYGGFMPRPAFPDGGMNMGPYPDSRGPGPDGYGRGGPMGENTNAAYPNEFQDGFTKRPTSKPVNQPRLFGEAPESKNIPALLKHLDSFRIETENDAQLVLKVTQKLTDALMDYRLRSIPEPSTFSSFPMRSSDFSKPPPRLQGNNERYPSNHSGPSRYPDGPKRYFK
ncbi:uncharacterized protein si:ch211-197h24.6 isoform X1 [Cyprinodon tularosa]|uniref:uncharacterized protein si:ch211-197h24.6 isoform X1 n=2 Tax=Cyprinodon tularosa TaxID=77115 RepID=UPI0018E1E580|nr:uncharacterized protein si:ch211-197h24.6 isoform X1 [Cyprinodon tularosa]